MFGSYSDMPAQLMQSLLVTSLQPDKNQEEGNNISDICGIQIRILGKGNVKAIKLMCFELSQMFMLHGQRISQKGKCSLS